MKIKKNIKKIAAIGTGVLLLATTIVGCAAPVQEGYTETEMQNAVTKAVNDGRNSKVCEQTTCPDCMDITSDNEGAVDTYLTENGLTRAELTEVNINEDNMDLILDHIYNNDGDIEYLTEDLKESEVNEIVERIVFMNDIKDLAIQEVEKEGVDELDKEDIGEVTLDEDDIEKFRLYDDHEDIEVVGIDFEDGDARVKIKTRFYQDDIKYNAWFVIEFRDGEVHDMDLDDIDVAE